MCVVVVLRCVALILGCVALRCVVSRCLVVAWHDSVVLCCPPFCGCDVSRSIVLCCVTLCCATCQDARRCLYNKYDDRD